MEDNTYRAPHYDPTVDELETLKQLEMGQSITTPKRCTNTCQAACTSAASLPRTLWANSPSPKPAVR